MPKQHDIDFNSFSEQDIIDSVVDLQKVVEGKLLNLNKFSPSLQVINRHLKQVIMQVHTLGEIRETEEKFKNGETEIGQVRKYAKPSKPSSNSEQPVREIGEVTNKKAVKDSSEKKQKQIDEQNIEFVQGLSKMTAKEFRDKYNNLTHLKSMGKIINELEGSKVIKLGGAGVGVEHIQNAILKFVKGDDSEKETEDEG